MALGTNEGATVGEAVGDVVGLAVGDAAKKEVEGDKTDISFNV